MHPLLDRQLAKKGLKFKSWTLSRHSWALAVFFNVFNFKNYIFAFFIKLIWLGVDFLNRNDAEIGYRVIVVKKLILYVF